MLDLKEIRAAFNEVLDNLTPEAAQAWYDDAVMRLYGGAENIPEDEILPDDFCMPPFFPYEPETFPVVVNYTLKDSLDYYSFTAVGEAITSDQMEKYPQIGQYSNHSPGGQMQYDTTPSFACCYHLVVKQETFLENDIAEAA